MLRLLSRSRRKKRKKSYHEELAMPSASNNNMIAGRDGGQDIPIRDLQIPDTDQLDAASDAPDMQLDPSISLPGHLRDEIEEPSSSYRKAKLKLPRKIKSLMRSNKSDDSKYKLKLPDS